MRNFKKLMAVLGLALALSLPFAAVAQERTKDAIYADFYKAYQAKDTTKGVEFAKEYLEKFPNGEQANYLKGYIAKVRASKFNEAIQAKNVNEAIRIANEEFAENPDNVDYLYLLVYAIRTSELEANPPNFAHGKEVIDYGQRATQAIEAGKPANVFKKEQTKGVLSYIAQTMANVEAKNNNTDKAIEDYKKSISYIASSTAKGDVQTITFNYYRMGFIYQAQYEAASKKFQAFPNEDKTDPPTKPEVKQALDDLNAATDLVIDTWAHFLASPESQGYKNRGDIETTVTELYKFRHKGSTDGLQKLIDGYKPGAAASSATSSATSGKTEL